MKIYFKHSKSVIITNQPILNPMKNHPLFILVFITCFLMNQRAFTQIKEFKLSVNQPPIEQCISTGIDQNKITPLKVFPNPSQGLINIVFTSNLVLSNLKIQICTLDGRLAYLVEKQKSEGTISEKFDISELPKGMYLLKLSEDGSCYYDRIVLY